MSGRRRSRNKLRRTRLKRHDAGHHKNSRSAAVRQDTPVPSEPAKGRVMAGSERERDVAVVYNSTVVHEIAVPLGWRMGGHGDPIAVFGPEAVLVLELRADGSVTWRDDA